MEVLVAKDDLPRVSPLDAIKIRNSFPDFTPGIFRSEDAGGLPTLVQLRHLQRRRRRSDPGAQVSSDHLHCLRLLAAEDFQRPRLAGSVVNSAPSSAAPLGDDGSGLRRQQLSSSSAAPHGDDGSAVDQGFAASNSGSSSAAAALGEDEGKSEREGPPAQGPSSAAPLGSAVDQGFAASHLGPSSSADEGKSERETSSAAPLGDVGNATPSSSDRAPPPAAPLASTSCHGSGKASSCPTGSSVDSDQPRSGKRRREEQGDAAKRLRRGDVPAVQGDTPLARMKATSSWMAECLKVHGVDVAETDPPWVLHLRLMEERMEENTKKLEMKLKEVNAENTKKLEEVNAENTKKLEEVNAENTKKLESMGMKLKEMNAANMKKLEQDRQLYESMGISRMTALVEVLDQLLSFLSFNVRKAVAVGDRVWHLVGQGGQPFSQFDKCSVNYKTLWWFVVDVEASGMSMRDWWGDGDGKLELLGRVPSNWDVKRRPSSDVDEDDDQTYKLAATVLEEAEKEFFCEIGCDGGGEGSLALQKSLRALLSYMVSYLKPVRNDKVHSMAIVAPLEWGDSNSEFSVDERDVQLKKVSRQELATKIRVLVDLRRNASGLIDKRFHCGLDAVLEWYETKLSRMASQFSRRTNEDDGVYYYDDVEGKWYLGGLDCTAKYLERFAARW